MIGERKKCKNSSCFSDSIALLARRTWVLVHSPLPPLLATLPNSIPYCNCKRCSGDRFGSSNLDVKRGVVLNLLAILLASSSSRSESRRYRPTILLLLN